MNNGTVMGSIVPSRDVFTAPSVTQATIHDQFMMAAITGLLAQGMQLKDAVHESRRVADAAMQTRKQKNEWRLAMNGKKTRSGFGPTGSAFPLRADPGADDQLTYIGLSRRDYFAAAALPAVMESFAGPAGPSHRALIAAECYAQADAMWDEACKESPVITSQTASWKASAK